MNARDLARKVLGRVETGAYASLALAGELGRAGLAENDRGLATELVYGVLKQRARLDRALAALAPRGLGKIDPPTMNALRLAAYQILLLRVADHAAVDDAVGAIKRVRGEKLAGFANAILRRLAREGEPPLPPPADDADAAAWARHLAIAESAPGLLVDEAIAALGPGGPLGIEGARAFLAAVNAPAPIWLRANALRTTRDELAAAIALARPRATLRTSPLCPEALAVIRGGDLYESELYGKGAFTAQDLGAQIIARLLEPRPGERLLDACAGVGGKSTHLAALTGDAATIDAADASARKLEIAADHARRLGAGSIRFLRADLTDEKAALEPAYDRVLLDAPCSGLGVLRRHPELKWRRTREEITTLAALQARLLLALAPRVRPGGVLVYSVCTFTAAEGPAQLRAFLAARPDFAVAPPPAALAGLACEDGAIRTWPHRDDADAFYAAKLLRKA